MHVFLHKGSIPNRSSWQEAVESVGMPFELDLNLDPFHSTGFSPSKVKGVASGFEIYSEPARDVLQSYPHLSSAIGDRDWCISFRWGGDMKECVCVLAASAGLLKHCDAVAYYPNDDQICDLAGLLLEAKTGLGEF
jgi:hypothetical protein